MFAHARVKSSAFSAKVIIKSMGDCKEQSPLHHEKGFALHSDWLRQHFNLRVGEQQGDPSLPAERKRENFE